MFNIKQKIYVTDDKEVDFITSRALIMHPDYTDVVFEFWANPDDSASTGLVFKGDSLDEILVNHFDGSLEGFFNWINAEEDLFIVTDMKNYTKLYSMYLLELQNTFGITDDHIAVMIDCQRIKVYIQGNNLEDFKSVYDTVKATYVPVGSIFVADDVSTLSFEIVYALYKWGYITKDVATPKIVSISERLLEGQVLNIISNLVNLIGHSPAVLNDYLDRADIVTIEDMVTAIGENAELQVAIRGDCKFNYSDSVELAKVVKLCEAVINNELDFDAQPDVDRAELDMFVRLFTEQDIDIIEEARYNFINTGFVASRINKFNGLLMMKV